ncbi:hypothetical protein [Nocardia asteroides]|uniref:hypothetical protein n=1 Tax=Nocardia asteroides TaxID=1824 RepID=UPI001E446E00|nr:hypothetical protein [Nocardia asteroides]UGT58917.1 hypothetical protein LTT85_33055 [Nocardia asteroides]
MIRVDGTELKGLSPQQTAALVQRRLNRRDDDSDDWMPASRLPTIAALDSLLPVGLPRGAVVRYDGSLAILLGMLAEASKSGMTAMINLPARPGLTAGLLAAQEMGAQLSNIAVVDAPEARVIEVLNVLVDGLTLVVADPADAALPPSVAKVLIRRAHRHECTLVLANARRQLPGVDLRLSARCVATEGLGRGRGYLRAQHFEINAAGRGGWRTHGVVRLGAQSGRSGTTWTSVTPSADIIGLPARAG